jgi:UDP-glucose 4-epimerase
MILIAGGAGFLGLTTAEQVAEAGEQVVITTHRRSDEMAKDLADTSDAVTVEFCDLFNAYEVNGLFGRYDFDVVIHTATAHMYASSRAAYFPSYKMLFNCLEAATTHRVRRFVLSSSIVVYRGLRGPFREDMPLPSDISNNPSGPLHFETTVKRVNELSHATETTIVRARITTVWGPLYRTMLNVPSRIALLAAGREAQLGHLPDPRKAHPDDQHDLMHANDCAAALALLQCAERLEHDVYNVSIGELVRHGDLVDIANAAGARPAIELRPPERAPIRAPRLATERLQALGFRPQVPLSTGMADYVNWLRHNDA